MLGWRGRGAGERHRGAGRAVYEFVVLWWIGGVVGGCEGARWPENAGYTAECRVGVLGTDIRRSSRSASSYVGYHKVREMSTAQEEKRGAPGALLEG